MKISFLIALAGTMLVLAACGNATYYTPSNVSGEADLPTTERPAQIAPAATSFDFIVADDFSEGLARVRVMTADGHYRDGFIDKSGNWVIPAIYDHAYSFSEGLAAVRLNGEYGFIDRTGNAVIPFQFFGVTSFSEGFAFVVPTLGATVGFIDRAGNMAIPGQFFTARPFSEGLAVVIEDQNHERQRVIDNTGNTVISSRQATIFPFSEGLALFSTSVGDSFYWGFLDMSGNEIFRSPDYQAHSFSDGLARITKITIHDTHTMQFDIENRFINQTGNVVIDLRDTYDNVRCFSEGLAAVAGDGLWGFIDTTGNEVIPPQFDSAWDFSEGLAPVRTIDGEFALIDRTGNIVQSISRYAPQIIGVRPVSEGMIAVSDGERWGFVPVTH